LELSHDTVITIESEALKPNKLLWYLFVTEFNKLWPSITAMLTENTSRRFQM